MPRKIDPNTLNLKHGALPSKSVDDNAFLYPERDVDPLRAHLHDPSRAHMASAIGIVDAADCYLSDEVEGALQELCGGMGAGRMNGLVEGGYIVAPPNATGNPPYPSPAPGGGLSVTLVAPATGASSIVLIGAATVDISGETYDFATGVDPVSGLSTNIQGVYYLYVETDSGSADYRKLVASTTLPTVASEKILIARITHDATDITFVTDARYFVANLDRKLPYTLRAGQPAGGVASNGTFGGESSDTWGEALFQTLEAALFWIANYDGGGPTQEEKATIIVRGTQVLNQNYEIPAGVSLQGSGIDAQIVFQGQGSLFTITGDNVRFQDLTFTLDQDVGVPCTVFDAQTVTQNYDGFTANRCTFNKVNASVPWASVMTAENTLNYRFTDCNFNQIGFSASSGFVFVDHKDKLLFENCRFLGSGANCDSAVRIAHGGGLLQAEFTGCFFRQVGNTSGGSTPTRPGTVINAYANNQQVDLATLQVSDCVFYQNRNAIYSNFSSNFISNNEIKSNNSTGGAQIVGIHIDGDPDNGGTQAHEIKHAVVEGNLILVTQTGGADTWDKDVEPTGVLVEGKVASPKIIGNQFLGDWINTNPANTAGSEGGSIGFYKSTAAHGVPPSDGIISNNSIVHLVRVETAPMGVTITDNVIESIWSPCEDPNVLIGVGSTNVIVTNNSLTGLPIVNAGAAYGVRIFGTEPEPTTRFTVTGNICLNHSEASIALTGFVHRGSISSNSLQTDDSFVSVAEGILLEGVAPTGSPAEITIEGNQIRRFTRGIRLSGYLEIPAGGGTPVPRTVNNVVVSNNVIEEIAQYRDESDAYSESSPLTTNQGILFMWAAQCSATGNQLNNIGTYFDSSGNPQTFALQDQYGIGIHVWTSTQTTITDNSIHNLYCQKGSAADPDRQPFTMGIYLAPAGYEADGITETTNDVCTGNTIYAPQTTGVNRQNNIAGIGYVNTNRVVAGGIEQNGLTISNNSVFVYPADNFENVPPVFRVDDSTVMGPGSPGIMVMTDYHTWAPGGLKPMFNRNLEVSGNAILNHACKGIFLYNRGAENAYVSSNLVRVSNNGVGPSADGSTTRDSALNEYRDAGICLMNRSWARSRDVLVSDNNIEGAREAGICALVIPDPSTPTTFLTEYRELSITNNVIPYVLEADATNFPDTFGILTGYLFNGVGSNDHALLEGITIEGNQIGLRDDSDSRDTGCLWATFFLLSTDPAAFSGNQENLDCRNVRVSNNVLNSEFTNVTFYHDGTNNAFSARKLDNVTVSNNTCFRRQEVYPAGGKHSTLASYIFFFRCVNSVLHETNISNNTTSVYRYSTGAAPGTTYSVRGLSILNEATLGLYASDNIRVHNNSLDTAPHWDVSTEAGASLFVNFTNVIKGTNFSFKDNTCSGFLAFDANATSGDLDWAGIEIENNQFGDPLSNGEEMQGRWGPARAMLITLSSSTAPTSQWAGVGVNNVSICGNRMTTHVTPSTPTRDNFQIQIIGINTNFHHWKVSDNQINALNSDNAGGIIVQPREFAHMYDWEICGNQIIGGGMPHVCWMAIDNAIVNGLRIEDNECSKINFPDGGWNASSGHPDAVILFEGSAPNVNDREGDERISISNNSIQLIKSTRPVIVDSNGVGFNTIPQNGVIFFGPSPDIDFDNGSGSESWKSVRNVVIEGNRMEQTDIDAGIVVNTYPVQFDVSCLSVSRNQIGHPTKNITDVTGSFVTPGHGITIQGKKLYSANALPEEAGRMGMTELAVENNQIILFSDSQNNNQLYGIDLFWKSDWDNSVINTQVGVQAYTVSDSSVSHNEIYFQETAAATIVKGIRVAATSELHNLRIDGNNLSCPQRLGMTESGGWTSGIKLEHEFVGSASLGYQFRPYATDQETDYGNNGGCWVTGDVCTLNPSIKGLTAAGTTDPNDDLKVVSWQNISVSNNSVLGDAVYNTFTSTGLPNTTNGAFVMQFVNYTGTSTAPITGADTRKQTIVPTYNFKFVNNSAKNDRMFDPDPEGTVIQSTHMGMRFVIAPIYRNITPISVGASITYRGWTIIGNTAQWYCMVKAANLNAITPTNTRGFDTYWNWGGGPTSYRIAGVSVGNSCSQNDLGTGTGPENRTMGWDEKLEQQSSNQNNYPWEYPG